MIASAFDRKVGFTVLAAVKIMVDQFVKDTAVDCFLFETVVD